MTLELYERPGCFYCETVRRTLADLDLEYISHTVPGPRAERDEVEAISGQQRVPVLVDEAHGVEGMTESDDIVAYLERTYGASGTG